MDLEPEQDHSSQRTLLSLIAIMVMVFLWAALFNRRPEPPPEAEGTKEGASKPGTSHGASTQGPAEKAPPAEIKPAPKPRPATSTPAPSPKPPAPEPPKPKPEPPLAAFTKRSAHLTAVFTSQDGALASLTLVGSGAIDHRLDYFRTPLAKRDAVRARRIDPQADLAPYGLSILGQAGSGPSCLMLDRVEPSKQLPKEAPAAVPAPAAQLTPRRFERTADSERQVAFRATFFDGRLEVIKTYTLPAPDDPLQRHILLEIQLRNLDRQPLTFPGYRLVGPDGIAVDQGPPAWNKPEPTEAERKSAVGLMGAAVATENDQGEVNVARVACSRLQKEDFARSEGRVLWAAIHSSYFAAILQPLLEKDEKSFVWGGSAARVGETNLSSNIETTSIALPPGQSVVHRYRLYAGPKNRESLAPYQAAYEQLLERRWLDPLSDACAWILRAAHWLIPNYGIAIIILTILVRTVLHPLSKKSQTSMAKVQKLQPQVTEMREKFKNDRKRQQEEMMRLYREYGVNPFGGCLPIFLQLPIFIGLWRALSESIELRHAPFCLWMRDLSQPDFFLGLVNVLPILSSVIMFIQQRSMPKSGDPQQQQTQKIMGYMMPVLLGWLFYNLASGLSLYFIASTLIGIGEQKVIKRHLDQMGDLKPVAKKTDKKADRERKRLLSYTQKRKPF